MQLFSAADSSLKTFLTDLVKEKHGASIATDTLEEFCNDLSPRLEQWITTKMLTEIAKNSETDLQTLQKMTEEDKSKEEVSAFIQSKIPDMSAFLAQSLLAFRQAYLGTT